MKNTILVTVCLTLSAMQMACSGLSNDPAKVPGKNALEKEEGEDQGNDKDQEQNEDNVIKTTTIESTETKLPKIGATSTTERAPVIGGDSAEPRDPLDGSANSPVLPLDPKNVPLEQNEGDVLKALVIDLQSEFTAVTSRVKVPNNITVENRLTFAFDYMSSFEKNGDQDSLDSALLYLRQIHIVLVRAALISPAAASEIDAFNLKVQAVIDSATK